MKFCVLLATLAVLAKQVDLAPDPDIHLHFYPGDISHKCTKTKQQFRHNNGVDKNTILDKKAIVDKQTFKKKKNTLDKEKTIDKMKKINNTTIMEITTTVDKLTNL